MINRNDNNYKLMKIGEVSTLTTLARSSVYALISEGRFPRPVKLSRRSTAWVASEVQQWIQDTIERRDGLN